MFAGHQVLLSSGFGAARIRLASLASSGQLVTASQGAYRVAVAGLGPSRLVEVQARYLTNRTGSAALALRWQAESPGGILFTALDATISLAAAGEHAAVLRLDGAYRPPPGVADDDLAGDAVRQAATAAAEDFIGRIADAIAGPARTAVPPEPEPRQPPSARGIP